MPAATQERLDDGPDNVHLTERRYMPAVTVEHERLRVEQPRELESRSRIDRMVLLRSHDRHARAHACRR